MESKRTILILGGDGYLGWTLGIAFGNRTDYRVVLADNMIKRQWEKEVSAKPLVPLKEPHARIADYERIFGKSNLIFEKVELLDYSATVKLIKKYKPFAVVNAAQQPSAPFSMIDAEHAAATFSNNIISNLNVLWAIAEADKNILYVKLGSAGCYMDVDTDIVPLKRVNMGFMHKGIFHTLLNSWLPMQATDFYHQSKIDDFLISDLCARIWNLKIITIQQSTIFGATIPENDPEDQHDLVTRFNYDQIFGTVLNRFVGQIAIDHPLTIYGDGEQRTGVVSLSDTIEAFFKFTETDIAPGTHRMEHNYTHKLSIKEIAEMLMKVSGFQKMMFIKNPRIEGHGHLKKEVEISPLVRAQHTNKEKKILQELSNFVTFTKRYAKNIERAILLPTVTWTKGTTASEDRLARAEKILREHHNAAPAPLSQEEHVEKTI